MKTHITYQTVNSHFQLTNKDQAGRSCSYVHDKSMLHRLMPQLALFSTILLATGQSSAATSYIYINPTNSAGDLEPQQYIESTTGPVYYSGSATEARASAGDGQLNIRSSFAPITGGFSSATAGTRTQAGFYHNIGIGAGTSGLNSGDPITLSISFSLDGLLRTSAYTGSATPGRSGSASSSASLLESSYFYVVDKTPTLGEGGEPAWSSSTAVDFQPQASLSLEGTFNNPVAGGWEYIHKEGWGWSWTNNLGDSQSAGVPLDPYNPDIYQCASSTISCANQYLNFDTGLLNIDFETAVGNTVALSGFLELVIHGYASNETVAVSTSNDFMNTFSANITDPYGTGIELLPELSTTVVPVPAAVWLFGSGLIGLVGVARRKVRV